MKIRPSRIIAVAVIAMAAAGTRASTANAALACSSGSADTVGSFTCTETIIFGPSTTDFKDVMLTIDKWVSTAAPGFTQTLNDVKVSIGGDFHASGTITNAGGSTQTPTYALSEKFTIQAASGAPASFLPSAITDTRDASATFTLKPGESANILFDKPVTSLNSVVNTSLSQYVGPGTFQALVSTLTDVTLTDGANIQTDVLATASAKLTITYDFSTTAGTSGPGTGTGTDVPEPLSVSLLALGLVTLALVRRSRWAV